MRPVLMLGAITGVRESLRAARVLARVGLLSCVASEMGLQVLQAGVGFTAAFELWTK